MGRRRKKGIFNYISVPDLGLDPETKKGIFIVFILAFGVISLLSLFDMAGALGMHLENFIVASFGWSKWLFPAVLIIWGYMLFDNERFSVKGGNYLGVVIFFLSFNALLFLFLDESQWAASLQDGAGGGYVGLLLARNLMKMMGFWASLVVALCLVVTSLLLIFDTTLVNLFGRESFVAKLLFPINFVLGKLFGWKKEEEDIEEEDQEEEENEEDTEEEGEENEEETEEDGGGEEEDEKEEEGEEGEGEEEEDGDEDEEGEEDSPDEDEKAVPAKPKKPDEEEKVWWKKTGLEINLPISLLKSIKGKPTSGDIKENCDVIRRTLENFGIPVEMGQVSVGPTVTQYTFKPAEGIKLSRVTNLGNDLALSLAAHPIRIEAPIPGKSLVGIEVPNQSKAIVTLREILKSKRYDERKNNMFMALGKDVAGNVWLDDLTRMPHLLVAGATNSGKSVCLNSIIVSLLYQNNPDDLKFIMVDPKRVELPVYNGIPYLMAPVITDVPRTINALKWCLNEMDRRFDILSKAGHRNIQTYNETAKLRMPYLVFIIDELADLMVAAAKDIEGNIIRLAQMARAVGIHLILATQRPSVDVITGLIKANMPARIAFSVASGTDSRTILDTLGAEKLLGRGDMLFMNAELSKPVRLQGAFLSDDEIKKVVRFIKSKSGKIEYMDEITGRQKVKGIGGVGLDTSGDETDEHFHEACEIVINMNKASASLLQRKLRIGYARAASLLDTLEEAGVIGPPNGSKPREILISKAQYAAMGKQGVSGAALHNRAESKAPDEYFEDASESPPAFKRGNIGEDDEPEDEDDEEEWGEEEEGEEVEDNEDEDEKETDDVEDEEEDEDDEEAIDEEIEADERDKKEAEKLDRLFSK